MKFKTQIFYSAHIHRNGVKSGYQSGVSTITHDEPLDFDKAFLGTTEYLMKETKCKYGDIHLLAYNHLSTVELP